MDPDNDQNSRPSRPSINTISTNALRLQPSKEQKIVNEILFDSFGYVNKNGYLGQNKIINYNLENNALRYRKDLGVPRSLELNHGVVPLPAELSSQQDPKKIKKWLLKNHRRKLIWKAALTNGVQSKSALPDDINMNAPFHCLRHWEKPNFMNWQINTSFKPYRTVDGDGRDVDKSGMRSVYDTWRTPLKPAVPLSTPGLPNPKVQRVVSTHNHVHY